MSVRVAVDAMGGDHAPGVVVEGVLRMLESSGDRVHPVLVGREAEVRAELAAQGAPDTIETLDAPEAIGMGESAAEALRGKPRSSIHIGLEAVRSGHAAAFASAGNTGAVMACALFRLGRLPGVLRPALPGYLPTPTGSCVLLDVGANVEVRPDHLVQFARMGAIFGEVFLGETQPTVGLINVGEEPGKGTDTVKEAYRRLAESGARGDIRFIGNVEGRDILRGMADVCVCDGFTGNVVLKLAESVAGVLPALVRAEMERQQLGEAEAGLVGRVLKGTFGPWDYQNFGGVPLLGIDGAVVIGHGGSSARAIEQMILRAVDLVEQDVTARIGAALGQRAEARPASAS